jgi:AcrR family transcriptional regulator
MPAQTTPRRKDAQRVHAAILEAAGRQLATDPESSFADIAHAAGVGQATVYRHFPDRRDLIAALLGQMIERLESVARELEAGPDRMERLLRAAVAEQVACQGLMSVIKAGGVEEDSIDAIVARTTELFRRPLAEAEKAGRIRGDLEADELPMLLAMVDGALMAAKPGAMQDTADRVLELLIGGLEAECPTPLAERKASGRRAGRPAA